MPAVAKITAAMFPELYGSLLHELNPTISQPQWQTAFGSQWSSDEDYFGYALTDGGSFVGVLGMIFSRRSIGQRVARFCNLHAWYVKPEYRARSLALMRPILELKGHTITDFTSNPSLNHMIKRLGLVHLDDSAIVLPRQWRHTNGNGAHRCDIHEVDSERCTLLEPADRQVYEDHQGIGCGHLLIRAADGDCYVVYSRMDRQMISYCYVHYLSNPRVFAEHHTNVRARLIHNTRGQAVVVDSRHLEAVQVPGSWRIRAIEKLYRPHDIERHEVDSLYSEVVLFKHPTFRGVRQRLSRTVKRCLPGAVRRRMGLAK